MGIIGDALSWGARQVFGDGEGPGALGTGQYEVDRHEIDGSVARIPGAESMRGRFDIGADSAGTRKAPTATAAQMGTAQVDGTQQAEFRQGQSALAKALADQANGKGPSLAQAQLKQATDRNLSQALALKASGRGQGGASAMRAVEDQRASISQQAAADSSSLALNEQMGARNALGQVLAGARGQDIALASEQAGLNQQSMATNAQMEQQAGLANQQAAIEQGGMNDRMVQFYLQSGMTLAQAQQQAAMEMERMRVDQNVAYNQIQSGAYQNAAGNRIQVGTQIARGISGAAGGGAGA